jgi:hypothetical protein
MNHAVTSGVPPAARFTTACSTDLDLYLHPLLEDPPARSKSTKAVWTEYLELVDAARSACSRCPLLADCLYKAVVQTDVSGYVGCTTPRERAAMRTLLGVTVEAEDLDAFTGARGSRQPVDHETVLAMRAAHPEDSLDQIANRLGCSLSTVKRHLRRARQAEQGVGGQDLHVVELPSLDEVFDAFEEVVESQRAGSTG